MGPHANEIDPQKRRNVHGQRENFAFGTQRNLYSTDSRCVYALGDNANFSVPLGLTQISAFLDTNIIIGIPDAKFSVEGLNQPKDPTQVFLSRSGI